VLELYPEEGIGLFASFNTERAAPAKLAKAFADRYFPAAEWSPMLQPPDWTARARRFLGEYRSLRFSHHDLTKLGALMNQVEVTDAGAGALRLSSSPETRWVEVEPLLFRDERGTSTIGFREGRRGGVSHLFLGDLPVFAYERVPWYERRKLHVTIAIVAILLFGASIVAAPARALLRFGLRAPTPKPQARLPLAARAVLWLGSAAFLAFFVGLGYYMRDPIEIVFGLEPGLRRVLLLPIAGMVFAAASLVAAIWIWRLRRGKLWARLAYSAVVIAFFVVVWQLAVWRLLGHQG
jgi:hypothetical protein